MSEFDFPNVDFTMQAPKNEYTAKLYCVSTHNALTLIMHKY